MSGRRLALTLLFVLAWQWDVAAMSVFGQQSKLGLSPADQKKYDQLMSEARTSQRIAEIAMYTGIGFVVLAIPLGIYWDRRKKARKVAEQADLSLPNRDREGARPPGDSFPAP